MNTFLRFGLKQQIASYESNQKDLVEALENAGPLGVIYKRKKDNSPYFTAGFVWRRIREHCGETQQASEAKWKHQWNVTYKAKYQPLRSHEQNLHDLLMGDTAVWLQEAHDVLQRRIDELQATLDEPPDPTHCLREHVVIVLDDKDPARDGDLAPREDGGDTHPGMQVGAQA